MLLPTLALAFQAAVGLAAALPTTVEERAPTQEEFEAGVLEHVLFEIETTLRARDLEWADLHGVNTTESISSICHTDFLWVGQTHTDATA